MYLCIVLPIYYILPRKVENLFLFIASLVFYGYGEPVFILLMIISVSINYLFGILIEKYAGAFPLWLAPEQMRILPISERHHDACYELKNKLEANGLRVTVDDRAEKTGYKIREAQLEKIPYMLILGDNEIENESLSVRSRKNGDMGSMKVDEFIAMAIEEVETKKL